MILDLVVDRDRGWSYWERGVWELMILGQTLAVLNVSGAADKASRGL